MSNVITLVIEDLDNEVLKEPYTELEIDIDVDFFDGGIGSYEFWGAKGYDSYLTWEFGDLYYDETKVKVDYDELYEWILTHYEDVMNDMAKELSDDV